MEGCGEEPATHLDRRLLGGATFPLKPVGGVATDPDAGMGLEDRREAVWLV